eukprot:1160274-Pelagomonas_calceolata.AAC.8
MRAHADAGVREEGADACEHLVGEPCISRAACTHGPGGHVFLCNASVKQRSKAQPAWFTVPVTSRNGLHRYGGTEIQCVRVF